MGYSAWAKRRRTVFAVGLVLLLMASLFPVILLSLKENPTCFDGKRNQGETAVDMGGPCRKLDSRFMQPVSINWVRAVKLRPGMYNAVALIENPNPDAIAPPVKYKMTFYDKDGIIVQTRYGETPIYADKLFPVYESFINTGFSEINRSDMTFLESPQWYKGKKDTSSDIVVKQKRILTGENSSRLETVIVNSGITDKENIYLVAIVSDNKGNAIAVSQSYLPYILSGKESKVVFTWPFGIKDKYSTSNVFVLMPFDNIE